jgi:PAS domain S-box-containing protein
MKFSTHLGGESMVKSFSPKSSSTILLVDDEPDIVLALQDFLEGEGYQIDVATTGTEALERVKESSYDAVLLDIRLPDIDGLLVLQKMAKSVPGLPIIILTGCTTLDSVIGPLEEQGAFDYLHKPINRQAIKTAIRHAVKAQKLAKKIEQAHHALQESERRFQAVFHAAQDAIVLANHQGRIMSWNPAAESMFGYIAEEIFGQPLTLIMPTRYREAHIKGMERLQATGEARVLGTTLSLYGLRKNGQEFPIELSLNSWNNGQYPSYSGFIRDISFRESGGSIQKVAVE